MAKQLPPPKNTLATAQPIAPDIPSYQPRRSRGFLGNLLALLLQPGTFFRTFPTNTQWVIVAILILAVVAVQTVRQPVADDASSGSEIPFDPSMMGGDPNMGGSLDGGMMGLPSGGGFEVPIPDGAGAPPLTGGTSSEDVRNTTSIVIRAAADVILAWVLLAILLCLVPLLRGRPFNIGRNLQIAVWASVPLGLMFLIRLIYYSAGGIPGEMGLSPLINRWDGFTELSPFLQNFIFMALSSLTLFWVWNIILIYLGGRFALNGRSWAAAFVTVMWILLSLLLPVVTGNVAAPTLAAAEDPALMSPDGGNMQFEIPPEATGEFSLSPVDSTAEATSDVNFVPADETAPANSAAPLLNAVPTETTTP